jgi:uncharacterized protein YdeI (YjbR/CyaY-like superfamily)
VPAYGALHFFRSPAEFRRWLQKNHDREKELWVGFHRKESGRPSLTWPESVDEALCFGWIDGVRKRVDETSYTIRFTPRRPGSFWSVVNTARVAELTKAGRMAPAGRAAFEQRDQERTNRYSYERAAARLTRAEERLFKERPRAWEFFEPLPPSYRRTVVWWVVSAKRDDTRRRRLETVITAAAKGLRPHAEPKRQP